MAIYVEYMQVDIYVECVMKAGKEVHFLTKEFEMLVFLVVSLLIDV